MFYNPYLYRPQAMPIQPLPQTQNQEQAICYMVNNPQEMTSIMCTPGTTYIGLNQANKQIYVRKMNNDGNIDVETYTLSGGAQEKNELQQVLERLDAIEKKLPRQTITLKQKEKTDE